MLIKVMDSQHVRHLYVVAFCPNSIHLCRLSCGHTFCQGCLTTWFTEIQSKYAARHPTYNPEPDYQDHLRLLADADLPVHTHIDVGEEMQTLLLGIGQPTYTCPTCRAVVRTRPVEGIALEEVAQIVGMRMGEDSLTQAASRARTSAGILEFGIAFFLLI